MKVKKTTMITIEGCLHPNPDSLYRVTFFTCGAKTRPHFTTELRVKKLLHMVNFEYIVTDGEISLVAFPRRAEPGELLAKVAGEGIAWGLPEKFSPMTLGQEQESRFEDYLDEPVSYKCNGVY